MRLKFAPRSWCMGLFRMKSSPIRFLKSFGNRESLAFATRLTRIDCYRSSAEGNSVNLKVVVFSLTSSLSKVPTLLGQRHRRHRLTAPAEADLQAAKIIISILKTVIDMHSFARKRPSKVFY